MDDSLFQPAAFDAGDITTNSASDESSLKLEAFDDLQIPNPTNLIQEPPKIFTQVPSNNGIIVPTPITPAVSLNSWLGNINAFSSNRRKEDHILFRSKLSSVIYQTDVWLFTNITK